MNDLARSLGRLTAGRDRAVVIGLAVSAVWLMMVLAFWLAGPAGAAPQGGLARLASVVGVLLPLVLIWIAVGLAQAIASLRAEAVTLRARVEAMRAPADRAAEPVPAAPGLASAAAARASARPAAARAPIREPESRQTDLPFEQPQPVSVTPEELVAALNFPDGPDDQAAISALRAALADPDTARTIRAAQDVVTLLAGQGVYMDDLNLPPAPPEMWRSFATGQRGAAVAGLATIDDAAMQDLAAALIRGDEVFRDAAHHFLRHYDRTLSRAAEAMNDAGLAALAATRSGRAFTLLAQVTGMFG